MHNFVLVERQSSRKVVTRSMSELVYVMYGLSGAKVPSLLLLNIQTSLVPRRSGGGAKERNAWYTLFAHAFIFRRISENRIFP